MTDHPDEEFVDDLVNKAIEAMPKGNIGWICPKCGRGNAPFTPICLCVRVDFKEKDKRIANLEKLLLDVETFANEFDFGLGSQQDLVDGIRMIRKGE